MNIDSFLAKVLPDGGNYYVCYQNDKQVFRQAAPVKTRDAAAKLIQQLEAKGHDVWVATGAFGKSREADDVIAKSVFYADFDAGERKPYRDKQEIANAVISAAKAKQIPRPSFVLDSGHGLHLYWTLTEAIDREAWTAMAIRFKAVLKASGLHADDKITADAARILRPPETHNRKDPASPIPCVVRKDNGIAYTPDEFRDALPDVPPDLALAASDGVRVTGSDRLNELAPTTDLTSNLDEGILSKLDPNERLRVVTLAIDCIGEQQDYDRWVKVGRGLQHLSEQYGDPDLYYKLWLTWSSKAPNFSERACYTKWHSRTGLVKLSRVTAGTFLHLAKAGGFQLKNEVQGVRYPEGFQANAHGTWMQPKNEEADWVFVCDMHFVNVEVAYNPEFGYTWACTALNPRTGATRSFNTTGTALNQRSGGLQSDLAKAGIYVAKPDQITRIGSLMQAFLELIQARTPTRDIVSHYGWREDKEAIGFTIGNFTYWGDGTSTEGASTDREIAAIYSEAGLYSNWRRVVQYVVDQRRHAVNAVIASAFAAPLIKFSGVPGAVLSIWSSQSGTGKTTALRCAQSVWGDPQAGIHALDDTRNAVTKKLEILHNLPAYWDELRMRKSTYEFIRLLFQLAQGKGKSRMSQSAELMATGTWSTLIGVASNEPLREHVHEIVGSTDAGQLRLIELQLPKTAQQASRTLSDELNAFRALGHNYGIAGVIYGKLLAANPALVEGVVLKIQREFSISWKAQHEERYWLATLSCIYAGAVLATKQKILEFDLVAMKRYLTGVFMEHRSTLNSKTSVGITAQNFVLDFIDDCSHKSELLVTDISPKRPGQMGRPAKTAVLSGKGMMNMKGAPLAQLAQDGWLFINARKLEEFVVKNGQHTKASIREELTQRCGFLIEQVTMGMGTEFNGTKVRCYVSPTTTPTLLGRFDGYLKDSEN